MHEKKIKKGIQGHDKYSHKSIQSMGVEGLEVGRVRPTFCVCIRIQNTEYFLSLYKKKV